MADSKTSRSKWTFDWVGFALTAGLVAVFLIALAETSAPHNVSASSSTTTSAATTSTTAHHRSSSSTTTSTVVPTTTTLPVASSDPSKITVEVLNGNGEPNSAAKLASVLSAKGFHIKDTGDADSSDYHRNLIEYAASSLKAAKTVEQAVAGESLLEVDSSLALNEVLVTVGATNYAST
jgi:LytR cell envelope-related transcriptional attenuator